MTRLRLARLRFLANFAAYHIPREQHDEILNADAGDDMLELCDAIDPLLKACVIAEEVLSGALSTPTRARALETLRTAIAKVQPPSTNAVDPSAADPGTPTTREKSS